MELKEKLRSDNVAIQKVCEYIIRTCDDVLKNKIMNENKTLEKMWGYVVAQAKKKAKNGCACIDDQEVYGWAIHYFDEDVEDLVQPTITPQPKITADKKVQKNEIKKERKNNEKEQLSIFDFDF